MRTPPIRNERGMALLMALFAMVVIGALVAGSFFVGRVEQVTGYNTVWAAQAGEAADAGLAATMYTTDVAALNGMAVWTPGAPVEMARPTVTNGAMQYTDTVRRLNNTLFLLRSTGRRLGAGGVVLAQQQTAQLVRLAKPTIGVNSAITVQDPIKFNGNSLEISGYNDYPPGWGIGDCPTGAPIPGNTDDLVGIRSSTTTGATAKDLLNIAGFPAKVVEHDPTITSDTFQDFLDYTYETLANSPDAKILDLTTPYNGVAPVADGTGACDKTAPLNLGEPSRPAAVPGCSSYFPIVHGTGAQTKFAADSRGQGTLLIDGDLELVGNFEWSGIILVRGQMKISGTGNKISGAILTEGVDLASAGSISGNTTVNYSKCAIERAMSGATVPRALSRGWAQVYTQ